MFDGESVSFWPTNIVDSIRIYMKHEIWNSMATYGRPDTVKYSKQTENQFKMLIVWTVVHLVTFSMWSQSVGFKERTRNLFRFYNKHIY